ncbi:hypothetical protein [Thioclava sp. F42-5]|uniref:hypothetical protein n=1 Tax=Thioclava sp. F42-5 TaxID=1973005 RepID=UPI00197FCBB4|nr:hypothetical protein [Thioclava sp. F42-5]
MSTEQVRNEIRRFLKADDNYSLCLRGRWGVGKTHTWDTLLVEAFNNKKVKPARYAYVSLFGLERLSDVRRSLFENTVEAASFDSVKPLEATVSSVSDRLTHLASKWRAGASVIGGMPIISDYSGLAEKAGFLDVRDQIVCFDDLERMSDRLELKDVLGLISFLKEKKRCKVVLLLNDEALKAQDAEAFGIQLEKVIDIHLTFAPSASEAVDIAIPDRSTLLARLVAENVKVLEITNIRTIFKLLRICGRLEEILSGYDERIVTQAIHSACLFGFTLYQPAEAPPIETVLQDRPYAGLLGSSKERTPEDDRARELLRRYGFFTADRFDYLILENMRSGIYDAVALRREADRLSENIDRLDKEAEFTAAWDIYHDSFDDNADTFAAALKQSIKDNAAAVSPSNLSASIVTLKQLGYHEGLAELIKDYIDDRKDDKEFWVGASSSRRLNVEDPDVADAFAAKAAEFVDERTLHEAVVATVRDTGWNDAALDFIDKHSAEDFYKLLKAVKGEDFRDVTRALTYFPSISNPSDRAKSIAEKVVSALEKIGQESALNRLRVQKYGIKVPDS